MSTTLEVPAPRHELAALQKQWWWMLLLGVLMLILGIVAISSAVYMLLTTLTMIILFGITLMIAGIGELVASFWAGQWRGAAVHVLAGILYLVLGFVMLNHPAEMAAALTFILGVAFLIGGLFRIVAAMQIKFHNWGWPLLNGIVTLLLGVLILKGWPDNKAWVIGLFVGIELIFDGLAWAMLAFDVKRIRA
jgi:uncharacterized membrane protein HdeD (DUF308 family)